MRPLFLLLKVLLPLISLNGCAPTLSSSSLDADAHVSLGLAYLQQGNLTKAHLAMNQALISQPHLAAGWSALGYLEEMSGNTALAAKYYHYAIHLAPHEGNGHNNYGVFLCRHGQYRAGIQELLLAAHLPNYTDRTTAYENAGHCALTLPDISAAQIYFAAARRNAP